MVNNTQIESGEERVLGLDLLRALAAVWAVVIHGHEIIRKTFPQVPSPVLFDPVDLFFTLSGFLIGRIILREIVDASPGGTSRALGRFWVRRWLRTLPAYYATIGLTYLFCIVYPKTQPGLDWKYFVFLQNAWTLHPRFMGNAWSLSIEEYFYLLFPLAVVLLFWLFRKHRRAAYVAGSLLFIAGGFVLRSHFAEVFGGTNSVNSFDNYCRKFMPARLDAIAYGTLGAFFAVMRPALWRSLAWPAAAAGIALYFAAIFVPYTPKLYWTIRPAVMPLVTLLFLPVFMRLHGAARWIEAPVRHLSRISYSMYLVHYPLSLIYVRDIIRPRGEGPVLAWYVGYYVITLLLTWLVYYAAERPGLALRSHISARWRARAP